MNRRQIAIGLLVVAGLAVTVLTVVRTPRCSAGKFVEVQHTTWNWGTGPTSAVGKWLAKQVQARSTTRRAQSLEDLALLLESNQLMWAYSSPTSIWYLFGSITNTNCWRFAVPHTTEPEVALRALPSGEFRGADAGFWREAVGGSDAGFQTNATGGGSIRLAVGQTLLVRHAADTNTSFLVQLESMRDGWWGDIKVAFRYVAIRQQRRAPGLD
jgi:hypothetical protein